MEAYTYLHATLEVCSTKVWDSDGVGMPAPTIGSYPLQSGECFKSTPADPTEIMH